MPKLVIQIPCYNEESCLAHTLHGIPRRIPGFDSVEILIIDDGSADKTIEIARSEGIKHILSLPIHAGLATAFQAGLHEAVRIGADVIVNTDADNQYNAEDIESIVRPILEGKCQVVVGERDLPNLPYFSPFKRKLHLAGNYVIRFISGLPISDATSGFRAIHRDAAKQIRIYSRYTYTIEMLLHLAFTRVPIMFVPIRCHNKVLRPSRLIRSNAQYIGRTTLIIVRCLALYRPVPFFGLLSLPFVAGFFTCASPACKKAMVTGMALSAVAALTGEVLRRIRSSRPSTPID